MAIDIRRFPWFRRLATDYAYNFDSVSPFFAGDPTARDAWGAAIARTQAHPRRRTEIAAIIEAQHRRRGAPSQSLPCARRLADASTVAVLTGQQAGLFGGPLFTLLKAITALKLVDQITRDHGVPAVAVFWVDAEDHDWNEVRSCTVFDLATTHTISLPADVSSGAVPIGSLMLDTSIDTALQELESHLPDTEFRSALLQDLRSCYRSGVTAADGFARWLERTLGDRGLLVYDASDSTSKPLAADVFGREFAHPGATTRLAARAGAELAARGYHVQVSSAENGTAAFHLDGERRPIRQQEGTFLLGDRRCTGPALIEQAAREPQSFSPNVLLRPIVQDTIFPTACYVAGPNELAYLAQLRGVYEHFGVPMPLVYPRATATLVDPGTLRFLTKYDVPLESLRPQDDRGLNELLAAQIPAAVEGSFVSAARAVETEMTQLVQAIPALDPTLEGAARSTLGKMQRELETLHGKMIQAAKRRDETLRRQYTRIRHLVYPNGHSQERAIGFISFLNQYGPALVPRLQADLQLDVGRHWIVSI